MFFFFKRTSYDIITLEISYVCLLEIHLHHLDKYWTSDRNIQSDGFNGQVNEVYLF